MKLSTRKDTELTADQLYDAICDLNRVAQLLRQRGAAVTINAAPAEGGPTGTVMQVGFDWRGRRRDMRLEAMAAEPAEYLVLQGQSDAFDLTITQTIVPLSRTRSRLIYETDIRPRNMRARLLLQTAKLGKSQIESQYQRGVSRLVNDLITAAA